MLGITHVASDWVVTGVVLCALVVLVGVVQYAHYRAWRRDMASGMDTYTYSSEQAQQGRTTN